MTEHRYELSILIGPCSEKEMDELASAILDLPEAQTVYAGAVGIRTVEVEDAA